MSDTDTDTFNEPNPLSPEQDARSTAMSHARFVLERRGGPLVGTGASSPPAVRDLIRVAHWIITGTDTGEQR